MFQFLYASIFTTLRKVHHTLLVILIMGSSVFSFDCSSCRYVGAKSEPYFYQRCWTLVVPLRHCRRRFIDCHASCFCLRLMSLLQDNWKEQGETEMCRHSAVHSLILYASGDLRIWLDLPRPAGAMQSWRLRCWVAFLLQKESIITLCLEELSNQRWERRRGREELILWEQPGACNWRRAH